MALKKIGMCRNKPVYLTSPYCVDRFIQRNLQDREALEVLKNPQISYPENGGRQKIRAILPSGKHVFLTIRETGEKIIVITGGEA